MKEVASQGRQTTHHQPQRDLFSLKRGNGRDEKREWVLARASPLVSDYLRFIEQKYEADIALLDCNFDRVKQVGR